MSKATTHVDPFIGVDEGGNCLCGPYLPQSIVRLSPDTADTDNTNGYASDKPIRHFSHTHVSGTGGASRYGNIGVAPFCGELRDARLTYDRHDEHAGSGYYSVVLMPAGIRAELTSTHQCGVHRYTFPENTPVNICINVASVVRELDGGSGEVARWEQASPGESVARSIGGYIEQVSNTEIIGRGDYRGGWGHEYPYSVYFYAQFDIPIAQTLLVSRAGSGGGPTIEGPCCRALLHFGVHGRITARVGISYVSVANARAAVDRECRALSFDTVRKTAVDTWDASLGRIAVTGGTAEQRTLFYTLFARLLCMPSDLGVDHEFAYWKSGVRHFTDYYCLWDSVRNANSLISLFDPQWEVDMLNCLLDVAEHRGWLPDAWIAGHSAFIQGGSSADILLCEAALKGLRGIDYEKALRFMRKNGEVESPDPSFFGRDLKHYRDLGYVSTGTPKACVSRHIEYAYQDWCIGALARKLGHSDIARRYEESSRKVWNLWRDDLRCFAPRNPDGSWAAPFDASKLQTPQPWLDPHFYEAPSAQWTYQALHDIAGLITRCGGHDEFVKRLDEFLANGYWSKEMMLHVPYLYIYAGRGDKTAEAVRACMTKYFHATRSGLHDNEDMGCQSAFYMCSAMGLYPVAGQDLYLLSAPVFRHTEIALGPSGKTLVITARESGERHPYVKSIALNGKPLTRQWIRHREIAHGATIEFELSDVPVMHPEFMVPPNGV